MQELAEEVCREAEIDPEEVYEVALAGNATMTEIALGVDPEPVGVAPFIMATRTFPDMPAAELGLRLHPQARVTVFPALGGYVGGDIVAGLLATGMTRDSRLRLFIDVGTNCEIALGSADGSFARPHRPDRRSRPPRSAVGCGPQTVRSRSCESTTMRSSSRSSARSSPSASAGRASSTRHPSSCGQGYSIRRDGSSQRGRRRDRTRAVAPARRPRRRRANLRAPLEGHRGRLANSVYLSQRDIRELQFAKAAIATGWKLLVEELGIDESEIQQVLLAGSFGSYLSPASAVRIGLVPRLPLTRIVSAGNVAGEGAKMALLSMQERHAAEAMIDEVEYVELSDRADFNDRFIEQLAFPGER